MKKNRFNLAGNIKKHRQQLKLTRQDLSKKSRLNYNTLIKLESGANKNPTLKTLMNLSDIFSKSIDELLR